MTPSTVFVPTATPTVDPCASGDDDRGDGDGPNTPGPAVKGPVELGDPTPGAPEVDDPCEPCDADVTGVLARAPQHDDRCDEGPVVCLADPPLARSAEVTEVTDARAALWSALQTARGGDDCPPGPPVKPTPVPPPVVTVDSKDPIPFPPAVGIDFKPGPAANLANQCVNPHASGSDSIGHWIDCFHDGLVLRTYPHPSRGFDSQGECNEWQVYTVPGTNIEFNGPCIGWAAATADDVPGLKDIGVIVDGFHERPGGRSIADFASQASGTVGMLHLLGYDAVLITYGKSLNTWGGESSHGLDSLEVNGARLASAFEAIHSTNRAPGYAQRHLAVIAVSMGAVATRDALGRLDGPDNPVGLYLSIDGPHLGASIPISLQQMLGEILWVSEMQLRHPGQLLIARERLRALNPFIDILTSPAASQMLRHRYPFPMCAYTTPLTTCGRLSAADPDRPFWYTPWFDPDGQRRRGANSGGWEFDGPEMQALYEPMAAFADYQQNAKPPLPQSSRSVLLSNGSGYGDLQNGALGTDRSSSFGRLDIDNPRLRFIDLRTDFGAIRDEVGEQPRVDYYGHFWNALNPFDTSGFAWYYLHRDRAEHLDIAAGGLSDSIEQLGIELGDFGATWVPGDMADHGFVPTFSGLDITREPNGFDIARTPTGLTGAAEMARYVPRNDAGVMARSGADRIGYLQDNTLHVRGRTAPTVELFGAVLDELIQFRPEPIVELNGQFSVQPGIEKLTIDLEKRTWLLERAEGDVSGASRIGSWTMQLGDRYQKGDFDNDGCDELLVFNGRIGAITMLDFRDFGLGDVEDPPVLDKWTFRWGGQDSITTEDGGEVPLRGNTKVVPGDFDQQGFDDLLFVTNFGDRSSVKVIGAFSASKDYSDPPGDFSMLYENVSGLGGEFASLLGTRQANSRIGSWEITPSDAYGFKGGTLAVTNQFLALGLGATLEGNIAAYDGNNGAVQSPGMTFTPGVGFS